MTSVRRPCSVSSLAAQPPVIPEPTTMASYCALPCGDISRSHACTRFGAPNGAPSGRPAATHLREWNTALEPARDLHVLELLRHAWLRRVVPHHRQLLHRPEEEVLIARARIA